MEGKSRRNQKGKLAAGETYEIEEKEWPTFSYAKFKTRKE